MQIEGKDAVAVQDTFLQAMHMRSIGEFFLQDSKGVWIGLKGVYRRLLLRQELGDFADICPTVDGNIMSLQADCQKFLPGVLLGGQWCAETYESIECFTQHSDSLSWCAALTLPFSQP